MFDGKRYSKEVTLLLFIHGLLLCPLCVELSIKSLARAHRGLPFGFLLLRFSVLFTVETLSLHYLLVIS